MSLPRRCLRALSTDSKAAQASATAIVTSAPMPSGVEHSSSRGCAPCPGPPVTSAPMPSGVEHCLDLMILAQERGTSLPRRCLRALSTCQRLGHRGRFGRSLPRRCLRALSTPTHPRRRVVSPVSLPRRCLRALSTHRLSRRRCASRWSLPRRCLRALSTAGPPRGTECSHDVTSAPMPSGVEHMKPRAILLGAVLSLPRRCLRALSTSRPGERSAR